MLFAYFYQWCLYQSELGQRCRKIKKWIGWWRRRPHHHHVFHQCFFHPLLFTYRFSSTLVFHSRSQAVLFDGSICCVVVVRSRRHHTHYHLHFHLHSQLTFTFTFTFTFTLPFTLGSNLKLSAYCLVIVWFQFGFCLVIRRFHLLHRWFFLKDAK